MENIGLHRPVIRPLNNRGLNRYRQWNRMRAVLCGNPKPIQRNSKISRGPFIPKARAASQVMMIYVGRQKAVLLDPKENKTIQRRFQPFNRRTFLENFDSEGENPTASRIRTKASSFFRF